ncbi:hypothetical protein D9615_001571 [Tricholomella constricta]|uniref:Yeast cell wall synthesis Kre9/Knh1-like N-terminal domain-containing protein n=1 Tax=Tricholomella constricta TaxID=117010 RepID=A0A8H5HPX7_9AGAR|nr:hypothetical protein D9615_001571 [Tricholomella constricta]
MQLTSLFATIALSFVSVVSSAAVVPRAANDVFVPQITSPTADTVWTMGKTETVTWDTSNAPVNISNGASVYLEGYGRIAEGFDLRSGSVDVKVPFLPDGVVDSTKLYKIILFGDSGNESPDFKIIFDPSSEKE